jgi:hypothetical protein
LASLPSRTCSCIAALCGVARRGLGLRMTHVAVVLILIRHRRVSSDAWWHASLLALAIVQGKSHSDFPDCA